jgi:cell wall-associated NlpC family hydrolase
VASLIYSPAIRVHVETTSGILDLSKDLVSWSLRLAENEVHTFSFRLQNAQRKYDGRLLPMDRISVGLKRLNWLQNMTGYLNDGPIFQAWPGTLDLTASCTLKIPQFWYWDPTSVEASTMIENMLPESGAGDPSVNTGDRNMSRLIVESMNKVTKWPKSKIHIGKVPNNWLKFATDVGDQIQKDSDMAALIGSAATVAGINSAQDIVIPAGNYAGTTINGTQAQWASIIFNTITNKLGGNTFEAKLALMCSLQECSLRMLANSNVPESLSLPHDDVGQDGKSVGLFQQQVGIYRANGTAAEFMNAVTSTTYFFQDLQGAEASAGRGRPRDTGSNYAVPQDEGALIQAVQRSGKPGAYDKWSPAADAMTKVAEAYTVKGKSRSTDIGITGVTSDKGGPTGAALAVKGIQLINAHKNSPIIYNEGNDDADTTAIDAIKVLDCSSLVAWVYYQVTGKHLQADGGHYTGTQYELCPHKISVDLARHVQGAAVFIGHGGVADQHVGLSLGNDQHVAAHGVYADPHQDVTIDSIDNGGGFNMAGLLPGIDYTSAATTPEAAAELKKILKQPTQVGPGVNVSTDSAGKTTATSASSALESLINTLVLTGIDSSGSGDALLPRRALMNDQPFLPWLANLTHNSMRSFCSAPNGDFMAWFPDYFGLWGTAAIMNVQLIELQDFTVRWSDQQMVTHQFVIGTPGMTSFDKDTANVSIFDPLGQLSQLSMFAQTSGIATMDYPEIFKVIYGKSAKPKWAKAVLTRFGARPDVETMPTVQRGRPEFFMALYLFMQRWANMFTATIPLTFMPELWPGMLLRIPEFGFQCYVKSVTHTGSYGPGGSFTTEVEVCAPANIGGADRGDLLSLLPEAGQTF